MKSEVLKNCIAHRGLISSGLIENSETAVIECIKKQTSIEVDLQYHPSGEIFVFHDENLDRIFNYKAQLSSCPIDHLKILKYRDGSSLLTLNSLLNLVRGNVSLLLELKAPKSLSYSEKKSFCHSLVKSLSNYSGDIFVQSFNPVILNILRRMNFKFPLGALVCDWSNIKGLSFFERKILDSHVSLLINQVDFISLNLETLELRIFKLISLLKIKPVYLWTIESDFQRYLAIPGVEKIIAENFYN
tara:strand:+ start:890 stop:1624 length:735 start_codon:yes stop_codon:yes gene_type:complete